jgi:hypothetical protein
MLPRSPVLAARATDARTPEVEGGDGRTAMLLRG